MESPVVQLLLLAAAVAAAVVVAGLLWVTLSSAADRSDSAVRIADLSKVRTEVVCEGAGGTWDPDPIKPVDERCVRNGG